MTDIKIGPPGGARPPESGRTEPTDEARSAVDRGQDSSSASKTQESVSTSTAVDPAALVEKIRAGQIDLDHAVEVLIDGVLASQPIAVASETVRSDVRRALTELVGNDPTLTALASAMKR